VKISLMLLPAAAALLAMACGDKGDTIVQATSQNLSGISATGTGKVVGEPDVVVLTVGVNVLRPTVEAARNDAAAAQKAVIDSLKANGVQDKDVQTARFSINPEYDYRSGNPPPIVGYRVENIVTAKIRDLTRTSKAIDDATRAGGNDAVVQNVSFTIDNPEELQEQARRQAVEKAKAQAQQMADAAGEKLGKLLSISESRATSPTPNDPRILAPPSTGSSTDTPIEAGELQVTVTVSVLYAID
jgi:uncharacterized protein YggE